VQREEAIEEVANREDWINDEFEDEAQVQGESEEEANPVIEDGENERWREVADAEEAEEPKNPEEGGDEMA
jgi:hypothetical protein